MRKQGDEPREKKSIEQTRERMQHYLRLLDDVSRRVEGFVYSAQEVADLDAEDQDLGARLQPAAQNLAEGIENLANLLDDWTDVKPPNFSVLKQRCSLQTVLQSAWTKVRSEFTADIRLELDERAQTAQIQCIPEALERLFSNLFRNRCEAGGTAIQVRCSEEKDAGRRTQIIEVSDDGEPIPPELKDDVFELGVYTKTGQTCVGLFFARNMAFAHGGTFELVPTRGQTIFRTKLPQENTEPADKGPGDDKVEPLLH